MDLQWGPGICILIKAPRWFLCSWSKDPTLGNYASSVDLVNLAGVTPETTRNLGWKGMEGIVYTWVCVGARCGCVYKPYIEHLLYSNLYIRCSTRKYVSSQVSYEIGLLYLSFQKETETWRGETTCRTFHSWEMVELRGELRWVGPKALPPSARVS